MTIKVDTEGQKAIRALCDLALRVGGLENLSAIRMIMDSTQLESIHETDAVEE